MECSIELSKVASLLVIAAPETGRKPLLIDQPNGLSASIN
jgi:hypothetical protein